mmetsp:Transcript_5944/g.8150  ORF Transcript_5944/g.8150 Transcript_5944/m.8150 type:complete len:213 (+) Transcript_5944:312-950(+)
MFERTFSCRVIVGSSALKRTPPRSSGFIELPFIFSSFSDKLFPISASEIILSPLPFFQNMNQYFSRSIPSSNLAPSDPASSVEAGSWRIGSSALVAVVSVDSFITVLFSFCGISSILPFLSSEGDIFSFAMDILSIIERQMSLSISLGAILAKGGLESGTSSKTVPTLLSTDTKRKYASSYFFPTNTSATLGDSTPLVARLSIDSKYASAGL